jgi:hypothetical protein
MVIDKNRVQAEAFNVLAEVTEIRVRPDQWIVSDDNGVSGGRERLTNTTGSVKMRDVREHIRLLLDRNELNEEDFDVNALCAQSERLHESLERIRHNDAFYRYEPVFSHAHSRVFENP